jgi:hypothetical protein
MESGRPIYFPNPQRHFFLRNQFVKTQTTSTPRKYKVNYYQDTEPMPSEKQGCCVIL